MDTPELESTKIDRATEPRRTAQRHTGFWLCAIGVFWIQAFFYGFERVAVVVAAVMSALFAMVWYLESTPKDEPPSKTEVAVATAWRWTRIVAGLATLIVFGGIPFAARILGFPLSSRLLVVFAVSILIAGFAVWVAIYGWRNFILDRQIHKERKRRYGWRE
jgi:hypothetical protein